MAAPTAQTVITDFEGAPATEELYLMVQSYDKLGMTDLKNDAQHTTRTSPTATVKGPEGRQELVEPSDHFTHGQKKTP